MKPMDVLASLNDVRDSFVLESALPASGDVLPVPRKKRPRGGRYRDHSLGRMFSEGWVVAAVCTLVAAGTLAGMVYLGQRPPPLSSVTDGPASSGIVDTAPVTESVVTASLVYVSHGDGTCSVKAADSFGASAEDAHLVIPAASPAGETVTAVEDYGFIWKRGIRTVTLPDTVTRIGQWAFAQCTALESVALPEGLTEIGTAAFLECTALRSLTLPEGLTAMGDSAFSTCTALRTLSLPSTLRTLPQWAFYGCTALEEIQFSEGLSEIGYCAFYGCASLRTVGLPSTARTLRKGSFAACAELLSVTLPEGAEVVEALAFEDCGKLVSVTLPESMTALGSTAFRGCSALRTVIFTGTKARWQALAAELNFSVNCTVHCTDGTVKY